MIESPTCSQVGRLGSSLSLRRAWNAAFVQSLHPWLGGRVPTLSAVPSVAAILPAAAGCAVHAAGSTRLLPWEVTAQLLDDRDLVVHTVAPGDLSPWDGERLLCAVAAGDPTVRGILAGPWPPERRQVHDLPRYPRRWRRTVDLGVMVGDLDATCCRAGLALPGGDPLREVGTIALLAERERGGLAVRQRLLDDHPWIGDSAWLASTGLLAETVVLQGLRREQVRCPVAAGALPVSELLGDSGRFQAQRADVTAAMRSILDGEASWNERGHLSVRPAAGWHLVVGGVELACGVGGLHSADPPGVVAGPLTDLDVASYYPSLIAHDGIAPPQLPDFARRVGTLMARRIAAKRAKDHVASNALKYVINSLYGQLGNHLSGLFSPPDALRVVLTGQLRLLELIDGVLIGGGSVVSVNTDGVVVRGDAEAAAVAWEARTGLVLERTPYQRLWRTSVNDYIAAGPDGAVVKTKGRFAGGDDEDATRRSAAPIVARAALEHLVHGQSIAAVVAQASVITDFALWRRARDLAWGGRPVERSVIRWVVGPTGEPIVQMAEGRARSTVAARAILVDDPAQVDVGVVDRAWYVAEAQALVDRVLGTTQGTRQLSLLDEGGLL